MTGHTDFLVLFQELGLSATCTLDEFKLAFRRRVSQLHPDHARGRVADESRLQRLTAIYNAAMEFHRRYGRLPGYTMQVHPTSVHTRHAPAPSEAAPAPHPPRKSVGLVLIAGIAALLLVAWLFGGNGDEDPATEGSSATHGEAAVASHAASLEEPVQARQAAPADDAAQTTDGVSASSAAPHHLRLGMSRQDVLAIEGEALSISMSQWDYGPSWIAFHCGKVSDWYSSPLRPLRTASTHPLSTDTMPVPRAVDCAMDP